MSDSSNPANPGAAKALASIWSVDTKKALRKKLLEAFAEDPEIVDGTNISVTFEDAKLKELHLIGTVEDKKSLQRAERVAKDNSGTDISIVNDLQVE